LNLVIFIPAASERFSDQTLCSWVLVTPSSAKNTSPNAEVAQQGKSLLGTLRAEIAQAVENITICLEPGRVLYVETPLPSVSAAKRNALLRYAIEDKLSADPAAIHAVIVGKSSYQAGHSIVAAIDTNWFSAILATLNTCKLPAQFVVDMSQALRWLDTKNSAPKVGVNIAEGLGFAVRDDGYALSFDGATAANPPFALVLALQEFAQQRANTADSTPVFNLTDFAPSATVATIDFAQWATATNQTLNDAGALSMPGLAQVIVDGLSANRKPMLPQMRSGTHAPASQIGGQFKLFKPAIWLAGLALAVHVGYIAWDNWRLTAARDAVQARMVSLFQKTFPDAKAIVDPALQMQRSLNSLKGTTANTTATAPFAVALADAATILGTQAGDVQVTNIAGTPSQIIVDATVATIDLANAVRTRMAGAYTGATITVKQTSDGKSQELQLTLPFKNALPEGVQKP
jgi:type II secretion system protein L